MRTHAIWLLVGTAAVSLGGEIACVPQERISGPRRDHRRRLVRDRLDARSPVRRRRARRPPVLHARRPRLGLRQRSRAQAAQPDRRSHDVTCTQRDVDDYGRIVAVCRSGSADLGGRDGALGIRDGVPTLQQRLRRRGERSAHRAPRHLGRRVHAARGLSPRRSTATRRRSAARRRTSSPRCDGCYIKGNINGEGERSITCPARRPTTTPSSTRAKASAGSAPRARRGRRLARAAQRTQGEPMNEERQSAAAALALSSALGSAPRSARAIAAESVPPRRRLGEAAGRPRDRRRRRRRHRRRRPARLGRAALRRRRRRVRLRVPRVRSRRRREIRAGRQRRRRRSAAACSSGRMGSRSTRKATSGSRTRRPPSARRAPPAAAAAIKS